MQNLTKPILHLFRLGVARENEVVFHQIGKENFWTSFAEEPGTLEMYLVQNVTDPSDYLVCELYADEEAYQIHGRSPQFAAYRKVAGPLLREHRSLPVQVELLLDKLGQQQLERPDYLAKVARIRLKEGAIPAFRQSVFVEMQTSMEEEAGVLTLYALSNPEEETEWTFFELYADEAAYQAHRQTTHFQAYLEETADLVTSKELQDFTVSLLVKKERKECLMERVTERFHRFQAYARKLKGAQVSYRKDWDCIYFGLLGKQFGLMSPHASEQTLLTLKNLPDKNEELRQLFPDTIISGHYANKQHWNSIYLAKEEISDEAIESLILESYHLVYQKFSKKEKASLDEA